MPTVSSRPGRRPGTLRRRIGLLALLAPLSTLAPLVAVPGLPFAVAPDPGPPPAGGFHFTRLRYRSIGGYMEAWYQYDGRIWERWETDHPTADANFLFRLKELSLISADADHRVVDIADDALFDHPFLYLCDVGWMSLDDEESRRLGEYLRRGGFLWVDDFWGHAEWRNFEEVMARALPSSVWAPLPGDHPLLDMLFPLDGLPQIPARDFARTMSHDPPGIHRQPAFGIETAELRGWTDASGRLVAVASFNSDIGDGWEREAYGDWFFERFSSVAYAFGTNTVLYALSH